MTHIQRRGGLAKGLVWGLVFGALLLGLAGLTVRAADTAKIEGVLKDSAGAVLAQANVTLKPPSGADKRTTTDAKGAFQFSALAAGTYSLTIESSGFQTTRYTKVELKEGQARQFDFSLRPGAVSSAIEIDITRPLTQAEIDRLIIPAPGTSTSPAPGGKSGVVAGRILDAAGAPAQAVRVGALSAESGIPGVSRSTSADSRTDSLGFYRMEVPPGRYFIVAGTSQDGASLDRPVYFPGVPDVSRALAIAVSAGSYDTADFRLDYPPVVVYNPPTVIYPPPVYYYSAYRLSGQVIYSQQIIVPQPYPYPYPNPYPLSPQIYVYPSIPYGLQVILQSGGGPNGCAPARTAYSASVASDGQFDFGRVTQGVYDVCVVQAGVVALRGGAGSGRGAPPRTVLYGPATVVVDRDIAGLRLDLGPVAIYR